MALQDDALTTDSRFFEYIDKTSPSAAETTVAILIINSITEFIQSYTGRKYIQTTYTNQVYDGPKEEMIVLDQFPISTFTQLDRRDTALNESEWTTLDTENYFVDLDAGIIYTAGRWTFALSRFRYRTTYTAGYDYDNATTFLGDTAAADLELATWQLVSDVWHSRKGSADVKSEKIGDYAVTYGAGSSLLKIGNGEADISLVQAILDKYKKKESITYLTPVNT